MTTAEGIRAQARQRLRDAMLDAARELALGAGGWAGVRMGAVAHAVGVSRQRLHAEFGTKDALGQVLVLRETERFLTGVVGTLHACDGRLEAGLHAGSHVHAAGQRRRPVAAVGPEERRR